MDFNIVKKSLVFKTVLLIVFVLAVLFVTLGWYMYQNQNNIVKELQSNQKNYIINQLDRTEHTAINQETKTLKKLSSSIIGAITESLYNMDEETVKATLDEFMQSDNIKAVHIYDNSINKTFLNAHKDGSSIIYSYNTPNDLLKLRSLRYDLKNEDEVVGIIKIFYNNDKILKSIAKLKNEDLNDFNTQAKKISNKVDNLLFEQVIFFSISGLLIAILITTLLITFVNSPLKKLKSGLDSFFLFLQGKQDYTQRIELNSQDEFGQMATSLNENIAVSARLHEELNSLYADLEKKVEQRTKELADINKEVQDSIEYASTIQRSFIKDPNIIKQELEDSFVIWEPRDKVGGDLYIYEQSDKGMIIGVIDCTGHSVPGGFMTMLAGSMIKKLSNEHFNNPAKLLSELNVAIKTQLNQDVDSSLSDDGLDAGLCYIDKNNKLLRFSGAKLDLIYFKDNEINRIKSNKQSIGYKRSKEDYEYTNHEINLESSETFYLYSDGITDQTGGEKGFPFGNKKFKKLLSDVQTYDMEKQKELIIDNLINYQGSNERKDDVTLVGFKVMKG
jgi:serine phosphatase RsbU (regulator of sigma subunit)